MANGMKVQGKAVPVYSHHAMKVCRSLLALYGGEDSFS